MISKETIQRQTIACLGRLEHKELPLPSRYQTLIKPEVQGELKLENRFFDVNQSGQPLGQLRTVTVQSPKINILNLLFFPDPKQQLPAYAAEFVSLSGKPIVAVIDAKCLLPSVLTNQVTEIMLQARSNVLDSIIQETELPDWFKTSRSGHEIFVRPKSTTEMENLMAKHLEIWQNLIGLFQASPQYGEFDEKQHLLQLSHYKGQHSCNYPGIPLLQRCFGEHWTTQYLSDYLFG